MGDENDYGKLQKPGSVYDVNQNPSTPYPTDSGENKPITTTLKVVVGERISLDASALPFEVAKIQWDVPGDAIKKYYNTMDVGQVMQLNADDKTKPKLDFYWFEAGTKLVKATITFVYYYQPVTLYYQWNFIVDAPKFVRLEAKTSKVTIVKEKNDLFLAFKDQKKPGIMWDWEIVLPATVGGFVKDLQTLNPGGRIRELLPTGETKTTKEVYRSTLGTQDLLDDNPIEGTKGREPAYDLALAKPPLPKIDAGKSESQSGIHDSPHTSLPVTGQHMTVDEHFKYFILFKPDKPDSIWVPVAMAEWSWQAEALQTRGKWKIKSSSGGVNKKGAATTEFPLYNGNFLNHQWLPPL